VEGPTLLAEINEVRRRQQRNLLATLILSQGTPMLCGGDELGHTQLGNNNAYCQDSRLSWLPWDRLDEEQHEHLSFVRHLLSIKKSHPSIWQDSYIHETADPDAPAILWFNTNGEQMQPVHWGQHHMKALGYMVVLTAHSGPKDYYLTLFNAGNSPLQFRLPALPAIGDWQVLLDTCTGDGSPPAGAVRIFDHYTLQSHATVLLHTRIVSANLQSGELF
jgi:isoamylase